MPTFLPTGNSHRPAGNPYCPLPAPFCARGYAVHTNSNHHLTYYKQRFSIFSFFFSFVLLCKLKLWLTLKPCSMVELLFRRLAMAVPPSPPTPKIRCCLYRKIWSGPQITTETITPQAHLFQQIELAEG